MSFAKTPIAFMLAAMIVIPVDAAAQAVSPALPTTRLVVASDAFTQAKAPALLTLKERLGAKWKDEQRVDNCKVPLEKRGSKPRSDSCAHIPMN